MQVPESASDEEDASGRRDQLHHIIFELNCALSIFPLLPTCLQAHFQAIDPHLLSTCLPTLEEELSSTDLEIRLSVVLYKTSC